MRNKLPVKRVYERFLENGIPVYDVNFIEMVLSAYEDFIMHSNEGMDYITGRLGCTLEGGESDREYQVVDTLMKVSGNDITFIKAAFLTWRNKTGVERGFVPVTHVDDYYMDKEQCDLCFSNTHCTKKVVDDHSKEITACVACLKISESAKLRAAAADLRFECDLCTVSTCNNNKLNRLRSII